MLEWKYNVILILELPFLKFLDCLQILSLATAQRSAQTTSNNLKRIWNGNILCVIDRKYHVTLEYQLYVTNNEDWRKIINNHTSKSHLHFLSTNCQKKISWKIWIFIDIWYSIQSDRPRWIWHDWIMDLISSLHLIGSDQMFFIRTWFWRKIFVLKKYFERKMAQQICWAGH